MRTLLLGLTVALAAALGISPAAAAVDQLRVKDGVLYSGCREHSYTYNLPVPEYADDWSADVIIYGPDGLEVASDYLYSGTGRGTSSFQVCGSENAGRWTIKATGEWYDYDYNSYSFSARGAAFKMRAPTTRATLAARRVARGVYSLRVSVRDERPKGFFPTEYADYVLQTRRGARWVTVPGTKDWTNERGSDTRRVSCLGKTVVRVRVLADDYAASNSKPRRIC